MATINVEHINPFVVASTKILKEMCFVDAKLGKPFIKEPNFLSNAILILIGFTGKMKGQVIISFDQPVACDIASKMIMSPISVMDDFAISAISELGNMIMGNAATIFSTKGIEIDITPPAIGTGSIKFTNSFAQNIAVPLVYDDSKIIEINIAVKGE